MEPPGEERMARGTINKYAYSIYKNNTTKVEHATSLWDLDTRVRGKLEG